MAIPPLNLYFNKWVAEFENRIFLSGMSQLLSNAGAKAAELAAERRRARRPPRPTTRKLRIQAVRQWKRASMDNDDILLDKWRKRWKAALLRSPRSDLAGRRGPDLANHKTYRNMHKHHASVLMQAHTGCVGMADFLFKRHVPDVASPLCSCGLAPETPEHLLLFCPDTVTTRQTLQDALAPASLRTRRDLCILTLKQPQLTADWLMQTGRFGLYDKAQHLAEEWLASGSQEAPTGVG
jgi:hypothetical protein